MIFLNKFLFSFIAVYFFWILQQSGIFEVYNIVPNLLLIVFLFLIYVGAGVKLTTLVALIFVGTTFIFSGFWIGSIFLLLCVAILIGFLRRFLTGNRLVDFLISVLLTTLIFYVLNNAWEPSFSFSGLILWEIFYNLVLGVLIWILFSELLNVSEKFQQS